MLKNISILTKKPFRTIRLSTDWVALPTAVMCLVLVITPAQSLEPKWPSGNYKYIVVDQDLRDILTEFGRNLNMNVKLSDQVTARRIRGRIPLMTAEQFLKRICDSYGLVWYYDGSVLHISSETEVRTELVELGGISPIGVNDKLQALGVTDSRFTIRSTSDVKVLSVSGPPPYLSLVRQTLATMQKAALPRTVREIQDGDEFKVRVFRGRREGS